MTVDDVAQVAARQLAVLANLQFVGIDVVDAQLLLQVFAKESESARKEGNLVAIALQDHHQSLHALGHGQVFGNVLHHRDIEPLQQGDAPCETLLEVNLAAHGTLGDGAHLGTDAVALGQFVDTLGLDERGVHVEADESAHAAVHVVLLVGAVHIHL